MLYFLHFGPQCRMLEYARYLTSQFCEQLIFFNLIRAKYLVEGEAPSYTL